MSTDDYDDYRDDEYREDDYRPPRHRSARDESRQEYADDPRDEADDYHGSRSQHHERRAEPPRRRRPEREPRQEREAPPRRRRRFRRSRTDEVLKPNPWPLRGGILLAGAAVVVWLAPWIVGHTPLLGVALRSITSDVRGTVTARSASLGWWSPVVLHQVELRDRDGHLVGRAERLTGETALLNLLTNPNRLSRVRLDRPEFQVVLTASGSNVEDVLANYLSSDEPPSGSALGFAVEAGQVELVDEPTGRRWQISGVDANGRWPGNTTEPLELKLTGRVVPDTQTAPQAAAGEMEMTLTVPAALAPAAQQQGEFQLKTNAFPLELVEAALRRTPYASRWAGTAKAVVNCQWNSAGNAPSRRIQAEIDATKLTLAGAWLGPDELRLERLHAPGTITWVGDRLQVEQLALDCELGEVAYQGTIDTAQGLWTSLAKQTYELRGRLDLSRLAAALPNSIRVREGTQVTDGVAQIEIVSRPGPEGQNWKGKLETSNLVAVSQGRQLTWEKPIQLTFQGRDTRSGIVLDHLLCQSSFLELEAAGSPEYLSLSSSYNLEQLAQELSRFYDLGDLKFSGDGWTHCTWRQDAQGRFTADGEIQVRDFQLVRNGAHPWREDNLLIFVETAGLTAKRQLSTLEKTQLTFESGEDQLVARLDQPLREVKRDTLWPLVIELKGELARWLPRLEPWLGDLPDHDLHGQTRLTAQARYQAGSLEISRADATVAQLKYQGAGWHVDEPQVQLSGQGRWDTPKQRFEMDQATLRSAALNIDASDIRWTSADNGLPQLTGSLAYVGDLNRLQAWRNDPAQPLDWNLAGQIGGQANIRRTGGVTTARLTGQIDNLVASDGQGQPWQEPRVRLAASGQWDQPAQRLALQRLEVESNALRCTAQGELTELDTRRNLTLDGRLDYDAEALRPLIQRWAGTQLALGGRQSEQFSLKGPLRTLGQPQPIGGGNAPPPVDDWAWIRGLEGQLGFGWQWAELYGFRANAGRLRATLRDGVATIDPLSLALSEGKLNLAGRLRLTPAPAELTIDKGLLADRVRVSPQLCAEWLKYVAPMLADVSTATGTFSVRVDGCRLPIDDPGRGDASGHLLVHNLEIGTSPLVQELALLWNRSTTVRLQQESDIQFRMVDGRIYHRDLALVFPDATIRTYGSVGLDESLAIMAEMPVPPKWIGNNRLGEALRNQTIRVPIGGTLSQPKLDRQALDQVTAQLLQNTGGTMLFNEIGRQLDRIIQPPKQR